MFSKVKMPKRQLLVPTNHVEDQEGSACEEHMEPITGVESTIKSKILSHFIKGKFFLTAMETMLIIPGELEYLEGLVKLAKKKNNTEINKNQVTIVHPIHTIRKVSVNKAHCNKTLHLAMEINQALIEGLVDTLISMLVMATSVIRKLGIMHAMVGHETYKTMNMIVTHALGRITKLLMRMGGIVC